MRAQPRRQLLIDTALQLFSKHGYHATGIDLILSQSGVSKATLYKHFHCKEALILATLVQRNTEIISAAQQTLATAGATVTHPALLIFDVLNDWFNREGFFGCNFINACSEYTDEHNEIHQYAAQHKENMRQLLMTHLTTGNQALKVRQSEALTLLIDGAIVNAHVSGNKQAALTAKRAAEHLLNCTLPF